MLKTTTTTEPETLDTSKPLSNRNLAVRSPISPPSTGRKPTFCPRCSRPTTNAIHRCLDCNQLLIPSEYPRQA